MDDTTIPTPKPPPTPPPPLAIAPPTPTPTPFNHDDGEHLFHPPTTPTTTTTTPSTSFRKKRRSKLLRIDTTPAPVKQTLTTEPTPCTECGKTFWSWKALFGHMRCHPERQWRGIVPPPHLRRDSLPPPPPTPTPTPTPTLTLHTTPTSEDHEVAASLLLLASGPPSTTVGPAPRFECSSCKKTFGSHQALGGHRASHKNVKGCFAITNTTPTTTTPTHVEEEGNNNNNCMPAMQNQDDGLGLGLSLGLGLGLGAVHTCMVCFKVFSTGQALGGHMRCHWEKNEASTSSVLPNEAQCGDGGGDLDLNIPDKLLLEDGASSSTSTCVNPNSNNMELNLRLGLRL